METAFREKLKPTQRNSCCTSENVADSISSILYVKLRNALRSNIDVAFIPVVI